MSGKILLATNKVGDNVTYKLLDYSLLHFTTLQMVHFSADYPEKRISKHDLFHFKYFIIGSIAFRTTFRVEDVIDLDYDAFSEYIVETMEKNYSDVFEYYKLKREVAKLSIYMFFLLVVDDIFVQYK